MSLWEKQVSLWNRLKDRERKWFEVYDRQLRIGTSRDTARDIADRLHGPLRNTVAVEAGGLDWFVPGGGGALGLGKFLKKIVKVAAPIALGVATGGTGTLALSGLKQLAVKGVAKAALKKTLAKKALSVLQTRVLPGVGKVARGAGRLSGQAAKIAAVGGAVGGGAAVGTRIGRGRGESLDVTFMDEEGMIVKTRGRKRAGATRRKTRSRRSSPIRRRSRTSSRRRPPSRSYSRRAPARRRSTRSRGTAAQRRARSKFVKRYAKRRRR